MIVLSEVSCRYSRMMLDHALRMDSRTPSGDDDLARRAVQAWPNGDDPLFVHREFPAPCGLLLGYIWVSPQLF